MNQPFDYRKYFDAAIEQIEQLRAAKAMPLTHQSLGWKAVQSQAVTNIGSEEWERYVDIMFEAKKITKKCIFTIIFWLLRERASKCKVLAPKSKLLKDAGIPLAFIDMQDNCLLVVTDKEPDIVIESDHNVPENIAALMKNTGAKSFKRVYLLHDYAYLQYLKHVVNTDDPGHGCNAYSLSWLFDTYFDTDEYGVFREELDRYKKLIDEYLGYAIVRMLNNAALEKFRVITEKEILRFEYSKVESIVVTNKKANPPKRYILESDEYTKMRQQFLDHHKYKVLFGQSDFAESLITAEWLRDSMQKAQAIDLTVIGTGYFKAAEQLLYSLAKLRFPNVSEEETIGNFAYRYDNNPKLFHAHLLSTTRKYVCESIYTYADLRNRYFHKHNIHDPAIIEEIRTSTFLLFFLLLGSLKLSGTDLKMLGAPNLHDYSDYDKLCDYVALHPYDLFCIEPDGLPEQWTKSIEPEDIPNQFRRENISRCMYFSILGSDSIQRISKENLPERFWIGKLDFKQTESFTFKLIKETLLFEHGRYVGPDLADEQDFDY